MRFQRNHLIFQFLRRWSTQFTTFWFFFFFFSWAVIFTVIAIYRLYHSLRYSLSIICSESQRSSSFVLVWIICILSALYYTGCIFFRNTHYFENHLGKYMKIFFLRDFKSLNIFASYTYFLNLLFHFLDYYFDIELWMIFLYGLWFISI